MTATTLIVLATEGGIPTSNPWSQVAVPLGIFIFVGSLFMLLRSNLGTRRGYLVMSTSLWGFTFLLSLFWTFGAPGTPATTGPQNLPGQAADAYLPVWVAFAPDSALAVDDGTAYGAAATFPAGWGAVPAEFADEAATGVTSITSFFSGLDEVEGVEADTYQVELTGTEAQVGDTAYMEAENGRPMISATFVPTCQLSEAGDLPEFCEGVDIGAPVPADAVDGNGNPVVTEETYFAFFDVGSPYFPSLLMNGILLLLFAVHVLLLARDETRERKEAEQALVVEPVEVDERATASV